jgi:HD-GYP domain-containing protein (c-di-GMP phosphodiesterase class II)
MGGRLMERVEELHQAVVGLQQENATLREALERHHHEAEAKEDQLRRYAADIRETFIAERARTRELHRSYMFTVRALANAVEARDAYTGKHAERVTAYAIRIARAAGIDVASEPEMEFGFLLHDVGKVAVPDAILFKPGPLTRPERDVIEQHPVIGSKIIREIDFLGSAREVVRSHHERWDGTGYPDRLRGEEIPRAARAFAIADVLDALTTERPYRSSLPLAEAREMIVGDAGTHFDPAMIAAYALIQDEELEQLRAEIGL